jgi:nucleoside-diphosphate-sugar epimerase
MGAPALLKRKTIVRPSLKRDSVPHGHDPRRKVRWQLHRAAKMPSYTWRLGGRLVLAARLEGLRRLVGRAPSGQRSRSCEASRQGKYDENTNRRGASPGVEASARTYLELEARASAAPGIEFVALRYGFFYGPGTWYMREGDIGGQVRQQQLPIIGEGQGVYSFVHVDDAAAATAAALECPPGAYNIVDGKPSPQHLWLTAFARAAGAPPPPRVSEEEALRASGPDAVYYATRLRGASNEKARRKLEFRPRPLEWIR